MRKFFKHKTMLGLVILVVALSIAFGVFNASKSDTSILENIVGVVITPVQNIFVNIGNGVSDFFGYFTEKDDLNKEIESLKAENAELKLKLNNAQSSSLENEQLRQLLNLKKTNTGFELETAEVVGRNVSNWYSYITVNKGVADGIALNQPVISSGNALVGRVCEVGTTWAKVMLISDPEHAAGAIILRSSEDGLCEGDSSLSSDGNCRLSFVSKNADIIVGDTVTTSGMGGIYPKGLIIGKVTKIRPDIEGISQYAVVSPEVDIKNIKAVLIIKNAFE